MEQFALVLFSIAGIMAIIIAFLQFDIVQNLKKHGINSTILFFTPSDLKKFKKLIPEEKNITKRNQMKINYYGWIISALIGITLIICSILIFVLAK